MAKPKTELEIVAKDMHALSRAQIALDRLDTNGCCRSQYQFAGNLGRRVVLKATYKEAAELSGKIYSVPGVEEVRLRKIRE